MKVNVADILFAVVALSTMGVVFGVLLSYASKLFFVEKDERIEQINDLLPAVNCGGCGYPGCLGLATAIVAGEAPANACPVMKDEQALKIAEIMNVSIEEETVRYVAHVACRGGVNAAKNFAYHGIRDCRAATLVAGGFLACQTGCIGLGTCVAVCKFDAIDIVDGVAQVNIDKCQHCGMCIAVCPKEVISLIPYEQRVFISCSNIEKGAKAREVCAVSCIACKICEKNCPVDAITVTDNIAIINYDLCTNCGLCAVKCPRRLITIGGKSPLAEKEAQKKREENLTQRAAVETKKRIDSAHVPKVSGELTSAYQKLDNPDETEEEANDHEG